MCFYSSRIIIVFYRLRQCVEEFVSNSCYFSMASCLGRFPIKNVEFGSNLAHVPSWSHNDMLSDLLDIGGFEIPTSLS